MTTEIPYINPQNVPESALGEGWRFCVEDERENPPMDTEYWRCMRHVWAQRGFMAAEALRFDNTYRTRAPLPEKYQPKPLIIEAGKSYRTRGGLKATVDRMDCDGAYPLRGVICRDGKNIGERWTPAGKYRMHGGESPDDLIAPWTEPDPYAEFRKHYANGGTVEFSEDGVNHWLGDHGVSPLFKFPVSHYRKKPLPDKDGWIPHTPGHCMPCDGEKLIDAGNSEFPHIFICGKASYVNWNVGTSIRFWRPHKPATKTVALDRAEDWVGGGWWVKSKDTKEGRGCLVIGVCEYGLTIIPGAPADVEQIPWSELRHYVRTNGARDESGNLVWEACSRKVEA